MSGEPETFGDWVLSLFAAPRTAKDEIDVDAVHDAVWGGRRVSDQDIANVIYTEMRRQEEQGGPFPPMVTPAVGAESFTGTALIEGEVNLTAMAAALRAAGYAVLSLDELRSNRVALVSLPDDVDAALRHYDLEVIPRDDGVPPIREHGGWEVRHFAPSEARRQAAALLAAAGKAEA